MKKINIALLLVALTMASCVKENNSNKVGELSKNEFDAWVSLHKEASWTETELGSWIISMDKGDISNGTLSSIEDYPYVRILYTISDLNGTISETTSKEIAQRLGNYDKRNYYGPQFSYRGSNSTFVGIEELMCQMGVGGKCKAVVPGWLLTTSRKDSKQAYINAMSSSTAAKIYEFEVVEAVKDTDAWELALLKKSMGANWEKADSLAPGVYYLQQRASDKPDTTFEASDQVYINYICRRIDGTGIDTNLADSAKVFGGSATGEPVLINWSENETGLTMTSNKSSVVPGFSIGIFHMKPHEKGLVYMTSDYGYGSTGSGSAIPAYCPIFFEIELVDKNE